MQIFGMEIHYFINLFFAYSLFGYILECLVLSAEYKKPVTNRGFVHMPFCIIYGFGAVGAYLFLKPFTYNWLVLALVSSLMATAMELVTAKIMVRLFGYFWWDYSNKKFNYRGIICLESSIGWGILGIFFFFFLDGFARRQIYRIPEQICRPLAVIIMFLYVADFFICMYRRLRAEDDESNDIGRLRIS